MKKHIAIALRMKADLVAKNYSNPDREFNLNKETFNVDKVFIKSENVAQVIFNKSSGKKVMAIFYYINGGSGYWQYFIPTDSHLLGLRDVERLKQKVELSNFEKNFGGVL